MTSSEADRFMLEHPEVAVFANSESNAKAWVASNHGLDGRILSSRRCRWAYGNTREEAIFEYGHIHHPEKSAYTCGDATLPFEDVNEAIRDSAKYRRIVKEFENYRSTTREILAASSDMIGFVATTIEILADDLKPIRCDKCGQELP